jgi:hypothetical protein
MEVEFSLTPADIGAALKFFRERGPLGRRRQKTNGWWVAALVGLAAVAVWLGQDDPRVWERLTGWLLAFLLGMLSGLLLLLAMARLTQRRQRQRWATDKRYAALFQQRRLTISPEGVRVVSPTTESFTRWPGFCQIGSTDEHAFFFITPENAIVVPRRAFATDEAYDDFVNLAVAFRRGEVADAEPAADERTGIQARPTGIARRDEG